MQGQLTTNLSSSTVKEGKTIPYGWKKVETNHGKEFHGMVMWKYHILGQDYWDCVVFFIWLFAME